MTLTLTAVPPQWGLDKSPPTQMRRRPEQNKEGGILQAKAWHHKCLLHVRRGSHSPSDAAGFPASGLIAATTLVSKTKLWTLPFPDFIWWSMVAGHPRSPLLLIQCCSLFLDCPSSDPFRVSLVNGLNQTLPSHSSVRVSTTFYEKSNDPFSIEHGPKKMKQVDN